MVKRLAFIFTLVLSGCATVSDRSSNRMNYGHELNVEQRLQRKIKIGMTEAEVRHKWGDPYKIIEKDVNGSDYVWIYKPHWKFRNLLYFKNGVLIGGDPNPDDLI